MKKETLRIAPKVNEPTCHAALVIDTFTVGALISQTMDTEEQTLILRDNARQQLQQIKDVESGIEYLNKVRAIEVWVKAEKKDAELQNMVAEQKIRTQRILGQLIKKGQQENEIATREDNLKQNTEVPRGNFGDNLTEYIKPKSLSELGLSKKESSTFQIIASIPEDIFEKEIVVKKQAVDQAVSELTTVGMLRVAREIKKEEVINSLKSIELKESRILSGEYDVIVIDPPWPMEKISRDVRPNQVAFDYPVMQEDELDNLTIPCAENCHVWVWTTHKFLPLALMLIERWMLKYVCTFVWHKSGGFQPIGLPQYNCEFAVYAHKGSPIFIDTKSFNTCFSAPRGSHSEKPEEFYEMVRRVTGGRRLDMFNRREIEGFETWGKEAYDG